MKMICLSIILALFVQNAFALYISEQTIEIDVRLKQQVATPLLVMLVKNEDSGAVTPYMFSINSASMYQYFKVLGDNYSIQRLELQQNGQSTTLCGFNPQQIIRGKSLHIRLGGVLTDTVDGLTCEANLVSNMSVIDVRGYRQASASAGAAGSAPAPSSSSAADTKASAKGGSDYSGIVAYLNALSVCEKGRYPANVNGKSIVYTVQGRVLKNCDVIIQIKGAKKPVNCSFSPQAVRYLSSSEQISMYESGVVNVSNKSKVTQVMNDSCR